MKEYLAIILEGGNVAVRSGDKWIGAQKIDVKTYGRDAARNAISDVLHALNKKLQLWNDKDIDNGMMLAGSGKALFNTSIPDEEFLTHKPLVGDVDVQIPLEVKPTLEKLLKPGAKFGKSVYIGAGEKAQGGDQEGAQINTLFKLPLGDGINAQFDFEFVGYEKKSKLPSEWSQFSHGSSWRDTSKQIKGVLHKYLLRAVAAGKIKTAQVTTPAGTKIKEEPIKELAFSVAKGLRVKMVPLADFLANKRVPEENKIKLLKNLSKTTGKTPLQLKREKDILIELPTASSEYITDVQQIMNRIGLKYNKDDVDSFVGIIQMLKEMPAANITNIFNNFVDLLFEQEIENPANYAGSEKEKIRKAAEVDTAVKRAGLDYFMQEFPALKGLSRSINQRLAEWQQGYGKRYQARKSEGME